MIELIPIQHPLAKSLSRKEVERIGVKFLPCWIRILTGVKEIDGSEAEKIAI